MARCRAIICGISEGVFQTGIGTRAWYACCGLRRGRVFSCILRRGPRFAEQRRPDCSGIAAVVIEGRPANVEAGPRQPHRAATQRRG